MENYHKLRLRINKLKNQKKDCMARQLSNCEGDIVNSHTISKIHLKNISSDDNHIIFPCGNDFKVIDSNQFYEFKYRGIKKSTTEPLFCRKHDNDLFDSFEKKEFSGEYDQIFALTFRALCREFYQKKFFNEVLNNQDLLMEHDQTGYTKSKDSRRKSSHLQREIRDHKFLYTQLLKCKKSGLQFILCRLSQIPIASTGIFFPLWDFKGNRIQQENGSQLGFIYNIIPLENYSYILLATVRSLHKQTHKNFLASINFKKELHLNTLIQHLFFNNDNVIIQPKWFETLRDDFKRELEKLMNFQFGNYGYTHVFSRPLNFLETFQNLKIYDITTRLV